VPETFKEHRAGSKIRILPDIVASQIAAGEVVERPVAVVKELVENSLDAGSHRIDVSFDDGGRKFIRVDDNGSGMCPDDALLSLERHATSKLRDASDLSQIHSFGFRGEALPSIASVSRFTMKTRAEGWTEGTEIFVDNGRIVSTKAVGMPRGTRIEVNQLFESVPARRKFLKSDRTESAHIILCCRLLALAHPEVSFSLAENGRLVFRSPACKSLEERVTEVFGRQWMEDLSPVCADLEGLHFHGLLSRPGKGRTSRAELFWFANLRPVENRTLSGSVIDACKGFIAKGSFPAGILFIDVDPAAIDVNVHPAKREIRLRDEARVRAFVTDAVLANMEKLARENAAKIIGPGRSAVSETPRPAIVPRIVRPAALQSDAKVAGLPAKAPAASSGFAPLQRKVIPTAASRNSESQSGGTPVSREIHAAPSDNLPARWRYIGFSHGSFILFETPDGILVVNRVTALIRILYEDYMKSLSAGRIVTQALLFPRLFSLRPSAAEALENNIEFFQACGFGVENFGADSFRVTCLPVWFRDEGCEEFIRSAAEKILENGIRPDRDENLARDTFARLAAIHAARVETPPDEEAALDLARRLFACRNPLADPKGNPTFVELSKNKLTGKS
jgi:DNA mismatch repair protein MutL